MFFANEWNKNQSNCQTIFYQGMSSSQTQLAKYTGTRGFVASTREKVVCQNAIDTIYEPFIGAEIDEVILNGFTSYWSFFNPTKLAYATASYVVNSINKITVTKLDSDNKDKVKYSSTVRYHCVDIGKISIGQDNDMASHAKKIRLWNEIYTGNSSLILYGVSRGALTTFNALANNNYDTSRIKMVILEGCPGNIYDVLKARYYWPIPDFLHYGVFPYFTSYKIDAKSPLENVDTFPEEIPVVFISSRIDKECPLEYTKEIANKLASRGKNQVYFLELERSRHPNYMFDDPQDRKSYETCIHAAYKKYNLPYIPKLAAEGEELIKRCRMGPS